MTQENVLAKVKELRKITGAGFKDCNIAIKECQGDLEKSIEFLRVKGISKASKKMERTAKEGLICIYNSEEGKSIIEINCETDFVAKNNDFLNFCQNLSKINFINKGNLEKIKKTKMVDGFTVDDNLIKLISKIGEKIKIKRVKYIANNGQKTFAYTHNAINDNIGKLGVIVSIKSNDFNDKVLDFGKKLPMHIAASNPLSLDINSLDPKIIEKEKELIKGELKNSGKPDNICEKILIGRIEKFKQENTLLNQSWVIDPKKQVKDIINDLNSKINIIDFVRYKIGE